MEEEGETVLKKTQIFNHNVITLWLQRPAQNHCRS